MIEMTYLKEYHDQDDTIVISFQGSAEDVYAVRDYAESLNKRKTACEREYGMCDSEIGSVTTCTSGYVEVDDNKTKADFYINVKPRLDFVDLKKTLDKIDGMMAENVYEEEDEENIENHEEEDLVNAPKHYVNSGMECIDEMVLLYGEECVMDFCKCNMHKYRKRALDKGGRLDLEKSDWYLNKYKELKKIVDKNDRAQYDMFINDMRTLLQNGATLDIGDKNFVRLYENFLV